MTITQVRGVLAGHWTHTSGTTGCTAILTPNGAIAGVAVPGHAPGSRELGVLDPLHLAATVHGVVLSGGSAFGLATADGVMRWLAENDHGLSVGPHRVPIVPAAILFDLPIAAARPDADAGYAAATAASVTPLPRGRVGAGAGCRVAKASGTAEPGGLGTAYEDGVGAVVALNAYGSIRDPETGQWLTAPPPDELAPAFVNSNTTLAVVAVEHTVSKAQANIVARMATAGLARTCYPAWSTVDGDTVFALSTGAREEVDVLGLAALGHRAARVLERAVVDALA